MVGVFVVVVRRLRSGLGLGLGPGLRRSLGLRPGRWRDHCGVRLRWWCVIDHRGRLALSRGTRVSDIGLDRGTGLLAIGRGRLALRFGARIATV